PQPVSELGEAQVAWRELGPHQNHLAIDFFGVSFRSGGPLRYQYKLEGPDSAWSTATAQRTINYSNLAPGSYRFLVRAISSEGAVSPTPASFTFKILPPLWRRWWFVTMALAFTASGVIAFDRYRAARLKEVRAALTNAQTLTGELTRQ